MATGRSIWLINNRIEFRELRALVAVADARSFRRAADQLGYAQSAVSHQVATLEAALRALLFIRPGGRAAVTLTPAGEAAYRQARRALGALEALGSDVAAAERGERAQIRFGVFQTAAAELLPPALRAFREQRPGVEVTLSESGETQG